MTFFHLTGNVKTFSIIVKITKILKPENSKEFFGPWKHCFHGIHNQMQCPMKIGDEGRSAQAEMKQHSK
jgi:hypothetical protein